MENVAGCLRNLSIPQENRAKIANAGGIAPLTKLISSGTDGQKEQAAAALRGMSCDGSLKEPIAKEEGAIEALITLARNARHARFFSGKRYSWNCPPS